MKSPWRSIDYLVMRLCERMSLEEGTFYEAPFEEQIRWLAYEQLREYEESHQGMDT